MLMGPGDARPGGGADQQLHQHVTRDGRVGRGHRAGLRVPADVHADRDSRRLGGDRALPELARHATDQKLDVDADDGVVGRAHDADVVRAGDRRTDGAGRRRSSNCCSSAGRSPRRRHVEGRRRAVFYSRSGIVGYSVVKIVSPAFYSLQDSRTPVLVSLATIVHNLALNLWLNSVMGFTRARARDRDHGKYQCRACCCGCCRAQLGGADASGSPSPSCKIAGRLAPDGRGELRHGDPGCTTLVRAASGGARAWCA